MTAKSEALMKVEPGSALAAMAQVLDTIPTTEDDPTERMVQKILEAGSAAEWEDVFNSSSFKDANGRRVRVQTFRWSESQFKSRTGVFLICDVVWLDTGEADILTVGGDVGVAQLLHLWKLGSLPHDLEILQKETPTKNGFYPMRFRSLGKVAGSNGG